MMQTGCTFAQQYLLHVLQGGKVLRHLYVYAHAVKVPMQTLLHWE